MDKQKVLLYRELYPMSNHNDGKEYKNYIYTHTHTHTHIYMTEAPCCTEEINTQLQINYTSMTIKNTYTYIYIYIYTHTHIYSLYLFTSPGLLILNSLAAWGWFVLSNPHTSLYITLSCFFTRLAIFMLYWTFCILYGMIIPPSLNDVEFCPIMQLTHWHLPFTLQLGFILSWVSSISLCVSLPQSVWVLTGLTESHPAYRQLKP